MHTLQKHTRFNALDVIRRAEKECTCMQHIKSITARLICGDGGGVCNVTRKERLRQIESGGNSTMKQHNFCV